MEEQVTNHSDALVSTESSVETTNTAAETTVTKQETEQPRGLNVKYNKEDRFIPEEEVTTWVQKGLNYDKVQERATQAEQYQKNLERIAKFYGYDSHDEYLQALEQAEMERQVQSEAAKLGVDESVIRDHLSPLKQKLQQYESQLQTIQQQEATRQVEAEISQLKQKYPDFDKFQQTVFEMVMNGEVKSLEKGYLLASYDERINGVKSQTEQEVLARVAGRDQKQVLPSNEGPSGTQFSIANASFDDIKKISQQVQAGAKITL